jgi:hypothetical protein
MQTRLFTQLPGLALAVLFTILVGSANRVINDSVG